MRARGCLIALGTMVGLLLICCVLLWFVGVPRLRDQLGDGLSEAISTEVANQLPAPAGGTLDPGTHTLSVTDLQAEIESSMEDSNTEDFEIAVDDGGMSMSFTSGTQEFRYSGVPVARDGRLAMEDMEVNNDFLGWVMPADRLGEAIEDGINDYFTAQGLVIDSVELGQDELIFTVSEAGT